MSEPDDLLDKLPGGRLIAKDLSISKSLVPGNPFCRFDTSDQSRKYCSKDLFENADKKFVIPEDSTIPRPLVECECCENDSYRTDNDECGRCGSPIFDCPGCGDEVHGEKDSCPSCGAKYSW